MPILSKRSFTSRRAVLLVVFVMLCTCVPVGALGAVVPPPILEPLNQIAVPEPTNLFQFVKNKAAAIRLGKALFWDMQVGSDGVTACASCHFSAGTDNRLKNTMNPGSNAGDSFFEVRGPNETLLPSDFPFHERQAPADFKASPVLRDSNDVVGSQGVRLNQFVDIVPGSAVDNGFSLADAIFNLNGVNTRQVTGRNTPSVINAIFNFSNFWDGRASSFFNGSSPFGPLDQSAGVWYNVNNTLTKQPVSFRFASLASQATGPPLSDVEMSFRGRTFPQLGRKMFGLTPLGKQTVHIDDSELGNLSNATVQPDGTISGSKGLNTSYTQMIRDAFQNNLWNSNLLTPDGFSQMEANFSLYWGLAIQLYEATLVSGDTPFDHFLGGDQTALTPQQQDGFTLFFGAGRCDVCHGGTELMNASVRVARFISNENNALLEVMPVASGRQILYDNGFNNTAVRPTAEDIGRAALSPFNNPLTGINFPLSFSDLAELQALNKVPFAVPVLVPGLPATFPVANGGAFKVPGLRNVELTAPYMHNGSIMTLEDVVEFYARGGNFPTANKADLDINIVELPALQGEPTAQAALVAFMKSMTDERVRNEEAPFDHPELFIPNGDSVNDTDMTHLPATGVLGKIVTVTLTSSLPSPQAAGTPITITASGSGGAGSYEYRFYLNDGSGAGFVMVRDYSPVNTWNWTPATSGNNDIFVEVRNAGTSVTRDAFDAINFFQIKSSIPATGVTLTPGVTSPQTPGTPVIFSAAAQGGSGPFEYRFHLNDGSGSGFVVVQPYGPSSTFNWTPSATGNYDIFVEVRTAGSTELREAFAVVNFFQVRDSFPATGLNLSASVPSPQAVATPITITASGVGGSGPYEYQFYLNDGSGTGFVTVQSYSPADTFVWTPTTAGNYDFFVEVRLAGSTVLRDAYKALYFYRID
ncbi:MAG: hypothetical protein IPQ16_08100 [Geobacteraceae bacterium]|nr:hypothetical protein [Geobacteraceae bacterium]